MTTRTRLFRLILLCACIPGLAQEVPPNAKPSTGQSTISTPAVAGMDRLSAPETEHSIGQRQKHWHRDFSSVEAYDKSVQPNRERLRAIIGAVVPRLPVTALESVGGTNSPATVGETDGFTVEAVRWPVFEGVHAEGLRLQPKGETVASLVVIPDADQTPEMVVGLAPGLVPERQFARRLAENGCEVLVPVLIDRQDSWSANARIKRIINESHRELIWRQALPLGRHIIGYEVQKVLAAVDFFEGRRPSALRTLATEDEKAECRKPKIGVAGYGEGGLIAFYAAAVDRRIEAALVSGYFDSRQRLSEEPHYRSVFELLPEFGDAEIASLIAPRALIVEHSATPRVNGPPPPREGRTDGALGKLLTPDYASVEAEFERARALLKPGEAKDFDRFKLITGTEGMTTGPGSDRALAALLNALGITVEVLKPADKTPADLRAPFDPGARQQRQVEELEAYTQGHLR